MKNPPEYRHIFFDLDGTLSRSRTVVTSEMKAALLTLKASGRDVIIVSGAEQKRFEWQADRVPAIYLAQNGNHAYDEATGKEYWRDVLSRTEKDEILAHIASIPRDWPVKDENDLVEDRECQISYSLLGTREDIAKKEAFDPDGSRRRKLLEKFPLHSDTVDVKIGGTTTLDYFKKGRNKGYNVARLITQEDWKKGECVYVGDALFPGGNDEAVVGVIDTVPVKDPGETGSFIAKVLG